MVVFWSCRSLTNIQLPSSLKSIGEEAFKYTNMKRVEIPKSCSKGSNAFENDCVIFRK